MKEIPDTKIFKNNAVGLISRVENEKIDNKAI